MREATPSDGVHLVTGTAGFIGFHLARRLLAEGRQVVGLDSVNDYYRNMLGGFRAAVCQAGEKPADRAAAITLSVI